MILKTKWLIVVVILASMAATFVLSNLAVQEKWDIRQQIAQAEQKLRRACADGANIVFTFLIFAPAEAIVLTTFWFVLLLKLFPAGKKCPSDPAKKLE